MKISNLKTNHHHNPIGWNLDQIRLSWMPELGLKGIKLQVEISEDMTFSNILYRFEVEVDQSNIEVDIELLARTRYYWRLVSDQEDITCELAYFETGKLTETWLGQWIGCEKEHKAMPRFSKTFEVDNKIEKARLYIYGVGMFEAYINQEFLGDEYLMPGYHSYDLNHQYRTYDITHELNQGENHFSVILGNGWYKGRFGFDGDYSNLYGQENLFLAEIHIEYGDGCRQVIVTDESFQVETTTVLDNNIYDGEVVNDTKRPEKLVLKVADQDKSRLTERINAPLRKVEAILPTIREHEDGYLLLDFGKIISGWVEFSGDFSKGQTLHLSYGEVLQDDKFYRDNLRTAKAKFIYTSDGKKKSIRPHFTYYGYRYVKIEGASKDSFDQLIGYQLMSDIEKTGSIHTGNEKVNRLIENTLNSQKSNFVDIPTDCPQRDERMGWTGDVAIFAGTACFHMDCAAFFDHYLANLALEQERLEGSVPFFVPTPKIAPHEGINPFYISSGAAVWADVATILPWTLYEYYGDISMMRRHYPVMIGWVDHITKRSQENEVAYLWQNDRQLGDWLALDNGNIHNPIGATDPGFIASAYYYHSTDLAAKAAQVLGDERAHELRTLAQNIRRSFIDFYYDETGALIIQETQTGCALALIFGLYEDRSYEYLKTTLRAQIEAADGHLNTGFVGTPLLLPALTEHGMNDLAYDILLNETYPSWLYEVNLGATTVWERWNTLLLDGRISGTEMNSLNHYAYGCVAEWMYRYMIGFRPSMDQDVKMTIVPKPDPRLGEARGQWKSVSGTYQVSWTYEPSGKVVYRIEVPARTRLILENEQQIIEAGVYTF